jgi:hypothetical protein
MLNWIQDYIYQPRELNQVHLYDFVAQCHVKHISKSNEDDMMRFLSKGHQLHQLQGVIERRNIATPPLSYLGFPNSSNFDGNIMDASVLIMPSWKSLQICNMSFCSILG